MSSSSDMVGELFLAPSLPGAAVFRRELAGEGGLSGAEGNSDDDEDEDDCRAGSDEDTDRVPEASRATRGWGGAPCSRSLSALIEWGMPRVGRDKPASASLVERREYCSAAGTLALGERRQHRSSRHSAHTLSATAPAA